jgi:3-oxoacyl-[acyl-carrier protein] reductase
MCASLAECALAFALPAGSAFGYASAMAVLVTGASGGIGTAVCAALAAHGVSVALHYRSNRAAAEKTRQSLPGEGHFLVEADLDDAGTIEQFWQEVAARARIEAVVNNAGIFPAHPPMTTDYAHWTSAWQQTLATNLLGPALLSYCAARTMAGQGGGRIVNVSSRAAFRGELTAPAYAASKAGLNAFSQSLAKALAAQAVYVFVVAPGWVATERVAGAVNDAAVLADQPLGRVATAAEVAQVVSYCALEAPASMTGAIVDVNGASYLRS